MSLNFNDQQEVIPQKDLQTLLKILATIRFGTVTLVIQDGRVIQIERNEKIRLV